MKRSIFFMDMAGDGNMNGVASCIRIMVNAFSNECGYEVTWVHFIYNEKDKMHRPHPVTNSQIVIPISCSLKNFLTNPKVRETQWYSAFKQLSSRIDEKSILHINTLNLVEFAHYIKKRISCKIVTHLHCIPWKGLYNTHTVKFNNLYRQYYIDDTIANPSEFILSNYERVAYTKSDCLICVTRCAKDFIQRVCPNHVRNIQVIPNGINDIAIPKTYSHLQNGVKFLFVGNSNRSKGLEFVLSSIQSALIRCRPSLTIVGAFPPKLMEYYLKRFCFLDIRFMGLVDFIRLRRLYSESDVGIIGSIQEQCSYVAIEMMMAGLPVITTDVDGLSELFVDDVNGFKIPVTFTSQYGLNVDIASMTDAIETMSQNPLLRERLGHGGRAEYSAHYTQNIMYANLKRVYQTLL